MWTDGQLCEGMGFRWMVRVEQPNGWDGAQQDDMMAGTDLVCGVRGVDVTRQLGSTVLYSGDVANWD